MTLIPELRADLQAAATRRSNRPQWTSRLRAVFAGVPSRRLTLFAVAGVLACGGAATAGVLGVESLIGTDPAGALFSADPQVWNQYNHDHPPADGVIQASATKAATLSIPRVGTVQYWVARTRNGGTCEAFKAPDGIWAGTTYGTDVKYNFGGIVPGCGSGPDGTSGYGAGFRIYDDSFGPTPKEDPRNYPTDATALYFGTVHVKGAVRVRDVTTGRTAPIVNLDFFVIEHAYSARAERIERKQGVRLQALNAAGKVLSTSWSTQRTLRYMEHAGRPSRPGGK
jgi:hypothetical protein